MGKATEAAVKVDHLMGIIQVAMELDPRAMYDLIEARVPCNAAFAEHPTIQVTKDGKVGFVGLLNGILARSGVKLTVGVTHAEMTMDYLRIDGDDGSFSECYRRWAIGRVECRG
jgi:hypothetical protein